MTNIQSLLTALQNQQFEEAETLAIQSIHQQNFQLETFLILASSLSAQQYYYDAIEILKYCQLITPNNEWILTQLNHYEAMQYSNPSKYSIPEVFQLPNAKIAIATIAKNEQQFMERWLQNASAIADEIVVVDTGSTDNTVQIIERFSNVTLVHQTWENDFAKARNAAFPHFNSDWVFWMDADEYLSENDLQLDSLHFLVGYYTALQQHPIIAITIHNFIQDNRVDLSMNIPRFFTLQNQYCFTGSIHEQIVQVGKDVYDDYHGVESGIILYHDGYNPEIVKSKNKLARNIELLQIAVEESPNDPGKWYYLCRELFTTGKIGEAKKSLNKALECSVQVPNFQLTNDLYQLALKLYFIENDFDNVIHYAKLLLNQDSRNALALYYLHNAEIQLNIQQLRNSFSELSTLAEQLSTATVIVDSIDPESLLVEVELLKAQLLCNFGHLADAKDIYNNIYAFTKNEAIIHNLEFIEHQRQLLNQ